MFVRCQAVSEDAMPDADDLARAIADGLPEEWFSLDGLDPYDFCVLDISGQPEEGVVI